MSRFAFNPEMSAGANFTPSGGEAAAASAIDVHRAAVFQPNIESHVAAAMPAAEQSIMSAVQAASQPISPLIQMIMRMPGQIGLLSSMFEALGNFLVGHANLLAGFDPSILAGAHSAITSMPVGEHMGISLSLLPNTAPILQNLGMGGLGTNGADMLGAVGKNAAGQFNTHDILKDSVAFRDQLKVSGSLDLNKPQFETGRLSSQIDGLSGKGDALSGPAMREASSATHLSGANRLFGDRPVALTSHSPMANPTSSVASAQTVPVSGQAPSSLNVSSSNFTSDMSATGGLSDAAPAASGAQNVGNFNIGQLGRSAVDSSTANGVGPSGAIGDQLGANKYIAMDKGVATFHPTLGTPDATSGYDASYLQHQTPADTAASHNLGGLKANQLSLDSVTGKTHVAQPAAAHAAPASHAAAPAHSTASHPASADAKPATEHVAHAPKHVMDHIGHQTAGFSHNHSGLLSGRDGIAHVHRAPAHVEQPRIAAQPQQMIKPVGATNASFEQAAVPNQQVVADGSQMQQVADGSQIADGSQVTDGTQIAQAGDASQIPAAGDATQAAQAAPSTYTIRAGDCLWNIAKDQLGAPTRWSEIYKMNTDVLGSNPSMIHPGTTINLPGGGSDIASAGAEHGTYIVKAGDNLWDISKHVNGDGSKWGEIYNLNKDIIGSNPSLIMPGQHLQLPGTGAESAGTLAQAPTAAASQQLASAPQMSSAPSGAPTGGDSLRMEGGTPINPDGSIAQTPVQSYSPAEMQAQTPAAAPETAMEAPQAPAAPVQTAPVQAAAPAPQAASTPVHLGGPGAAAAATLPPQPTPAELHQLTAPKNDVVSSNLTADLAQFIRKTK
ncbi:MAG: LysM peptidoglycan-binding domain-containing protein [Cyanobacteria bacterium SZAS LIN-5]|nr:LysM peptidoglycan-binding domain-containing protein [Cyanobacteria bacterium SZAS LIN-5]RTL44085.1 MAG: LysM peptidoglycan-binding domain-containing protein [Candidatus Melainabacteria bacterium]